MSLEASEVSRTTTPVEPHRQQTETEPSGALVVALAHGPVQRRHEVGLDGADRGEGCHGPAGILVPHGFVGGAHGPLRVTTLEPVPAICVVTGGRLDVGPDEPV